MKTLEPYQQRAVEWICTQIRGLVQIPAAGGKTVTAAAALAQMAQAWWLDRPMRIGWLAPTIETRDQATAALQEHSHLVEHTRIRCSCVTPGLDMSDRDVLIVDEAKHSTAPTWRRIIEKCPVRFGLDATPFSGDPSRDQDLLALYGNLIFKVDRAEVSARLVSARVITLHDSDDVSARIDAAIELEYRRRCRSLRGPKSFKRLAARRIQEVLRKLTLAQARSTSAAKARQLDALQAELNARFQIYRHCAWFACADLGIKHNTARTQAAVRTAQQHARDRVLVLVNQIEHGAQIAAAIGERAVLVHSQLGQRARTAALDSIRTGRKTCLVATSLADEGLDLPCLNVLILVSGGRSRIKAEQRTGRVLRAFRGKEQGIIYDFSDTHAHRVLAGQFRERLSLYKSLGYAVTP